MSEATVTIGELAAALNRKPAEVEREAAELGMLVRPDWQGRPSLTVDEADGLTTGEADETSNMKPPGRSINAIPNDGSRAAVGPSGSRQGGAGEGRHPRTGACLPGGPGCRRRGRCPVRKAEPTPSVRLRRLLARTWNTSASRRHPHDR